MDMLCVRDDGTCQLHVLAAALHSLSLYCAVIATALICCCSSPSRCWYGSKGSKWRGQNLRGIASLALGVTWCCGAAAASLRPADTVRLVASLMAPLAWLATAAMHISLWIRRTTPPILFLVIYWFLSSAASAAIVYNFVVVGVVSNHVQIYIHGMTVILALIISAVDWLCFYDEVTKRPSCRQRSFSEAEKNLYKCAQTHFYSRITFFWLIRLLYYGYWSPLVKEDLENKLPEKEQSHLYFNKFKTVYRNNIKIVANNTELNIWQCYFRMVWPNFYIAGILKLFGDLISVIPALGLAVIIKFVNDPVFYYNSNSEVTIQELLSNGYAMLVIVTLALIIQALLSQNSTYLVTIGGTRLKMGLQCLIYDKCTRLSLWFADPDTEESPLLNNNKEGTDVLTGLLTNLLSQDTYNIMSCVWIFHYTWAIPFKVVVILYLLYTTLGISAIIGTAISLSIITPLQLYIGKKISDNSRDAAKCADHRISKISEILQGINVIKLYVWEDLFNEKVLHLREVELKVLNRDSAYWGFLNFTTQISTIFIAVITFMAHYCLDDTINLNTFNVFAGLALFNQLTVPLLILPVTILMIIQAVVSTKRIKDFLELPETHNVRDEETTGSDYLNNDSLSPKEEDNPLSEHNESHMDVNDELFYDNCETNDTRNNQLHLIEFRSAAFSWKIKDYESSWLEVDELHIPVGKLVMVVGASSSGKSSLLSALLGEMNYERGDVKVSRKCSIWYSGQPPWLLEGTIKHNIVMGSVWCPQKYTRVLRATGLRTDLQLLPDGDNTYLRCCGTPLSGGQRVRLCIARALYSRANLVILDEPFAALDPHLAQHVLTKGLLNAVRGGRTVVIATNRLELLHYADMIIAMEGGRVNVIGRLSVGGVMGHWAQLAAEARAAAKRIGAGPPGGSSRERRQLLRAISRKEFQLQTSEDTMIKTNELIGAHLLTEVPMCIGGSWQRTPIRMNLSYSRQCSSPSSSVQRLKWSREVRRAVSADATNEILQQEAGLIRWILSGRPYQTVSRWTDRSLQHLLGASFDAPAPEVQLNGAVIDTTTDETFTSMSTNGIDMSAVPVPSHFPTTNKGEPVWAEYLIWWNYVRACGWWGLVYVVCAAAAQAVAVTADYWLSHLTAKNSLTPLTIDQKLPTAINRWAQMCFLCIAAIVVNVIASPWTLFAMIPLFILYYTMQSVYLRNARGLQHIEAETAARVVSMASETLMGAVTVRAGQIQSLMLNSFCHCLDNNNNALLLLNSANRWLSLTMDMVGAVSVFVSLAAVLHGGGGGPLAGLAATYSLLLPVFLAHLAKCRADLDLQLSSLQRIHFDTDIPQEDYRDDCPIPTGWQRDGKIEFQDVSIQHQENTEPVLKNINFIVNPGQKIAICGRSGSGKSTLLLSCAGATIIRSGRLLIDGVDIKRVPLRTLRHRVVVLPQEAFIFSGTLRENLDPLAVHTDDEIWRCLRAVGLCEYVTTQSAGLECSVMGWGGGRGGVWGGGRGARVCAARAALHSQFAAMLLLDEPGAALDPTAERTLLQAFSAVAPNITIVTIAHRVSSVRGYDSVVVLEAGAVAERGDPTTLLQAPSSRLCRALAAQHEHVAR